MRVKFYPTFLILAMTIAFVGCQKEESFKASDFKPLTAEQYLNRVASSILFQVETTNITTNTVTGWIIDKSGMIREYDASVISNSFPTTNKWKKADIVQLDYISEDVIGSVNLDALVDNYKLSKALTNEEVDSRGMPNDGDVLTGFYAFKLMDENNCNADSGQCSMSTSNQNEDSYYIKTTLKLSGSLELSHPQNTAKVISDWLEALEIELGQ